MSATGDYTIKVPIVPREPATVPVTFHNFTVPSPTPDQNPVPSSTISISGYPAAVAVSVDGTRVYVASRSTTSNQPGTLSVVDSAAQGVVATVPAGRTPSIVAVSAEGTRAYVGNMGDRSVTVVDTTANTRVATIQNAFSTPFGPGGLAVSPDGSRVYATAAPTSAGHVAIIDTTSNKVVDDISIGRSTTGVALSSDGAHLYVSNSDGTLAVIETATKNVAATVALTYTYTIASYYDNVSIPNRQVPAQDITVPGDTKALVVSPDGKTAYVSTDRGPTFVVDLTANKISTVLSRPFSLISDVSYPQDIAISPDGKTVYAANTIYLDIVNTASFETTQKPVQDPLHGTQLAVSTDGTTLYVAGYTKTDSGYLEVVALT